MRRLQAGVSVAAAMLVATSVSVMAGVGPAGAASGAARLMALNPGALLGGRTIVGTTNGQHLTAGSGNDTIGADGPNETVVGGSGVDQIGAFAPGVTIHGGTGSDVIYGGPDATLVSGSAPDLLIDTHNDGTLRLTGDRDEVIVTGQDDHVICEPTSHNDLIYANRSTSVDPTCLTNNARLSRQDQGLPKATPQLTAITLASVQGAGTTGDPFVAPCDNPSQVDCTVSSFPSRRLDGLWANEFVPAYRCPADHPYLVFHSYAPGGTTLPPGVEINQGGIPNGGSVWAINVYIDSVSYTRATSGKHTLIGFGTGTKTGVGTGATNWSTGSPTYQVILHCTSNIDNAYYQ